MAIEIPEAFQAAAFIFPTPPDEVDPALGTPFVSQRGFQPYDPSSSSDGATFENVRGGFTYIEEGSYVLKTVDGNDLLNAVVKCEALTSITDGAVGAYLPSAVLGIPPTLNDGFSIGVQAGNNDGTPGDVQFQIAVWRYNTENTSAVLAP